MKYVIEAAGKLTEDGVSKNVLIPVEIVVEGEREDTFIVFDLGNGRVWWIPISELDHLMYIVEGLIE